MQLEKYFGVISKVIDKDLFTIEVDIPGKNEQLKAFPYRGEVDEPRVGDFVELEEVDPIYHSYYLYKKLKENDFIGIRARGKKIWINEDMIQVGIFPPDNNNNEFDSPAGEWYDDKSGKDQTPKCTSWVRISKEGNIDVEMEGAGKVHITADHEVKVDGNVTVKIGGNADVEVAGNVCMDVKGSTELSCPDVTITGGNLTVGGACSASGQGGFCGLPACLLTGAPHVGHMITGT